MRSFSIWSLSVWICPLSCDPSLVVTDAAITGRETPHARPSACRRRKREGGSLRGGPGETDEERLVDGWMGGGRFHRSCSYQLPVQ